MNLLEPVARHMGIDLSGGDIRVAEHHLNRAKVGSPLKKVACKGVTEKMRSDPFPDSRLSAVPLDPFPEALATHGLPRTVHEKLRAILPLRQFRASRLQIKTQPFDRFDSNGDSPFLRAFPIEDDISSFEVELITGRCINSDTLIPVA